jgi:hypothetical protein
MDATNPNMESLKIKSKTAPIAPSPASKTVGSRSSKMEMIRMPDRENIRILKS